MSQILVNRHDGGDALIDQFNTSGIFVQTFDYTADLPVFTNVLQCLFKVWNGTYLNMDDLTYTMRLSSLLAFVSSSTLTSPIPLDTRSSPQYYPNVLDGASSVIGLWQDIAQTICVLQRIDPVTLAQTTLYTDFAPVVGLGIGGRGLSRDGNIFFYTQTGDDLRAFNLTTGINSVFITAPAGYFIPNNGNYGIFQLPDDSYIVMWEDNGVNTHVIQYDSSGTPTGMDVTTNMLSFVSFAPESDGSAFWIIGTNTTLTQNVLRRFLIPSGVISINTVVATPPDFSYGDMCVETASATTPTVTGLFADCVEGNIIVRGTGFTGSPTVLLLDSMSNPVTPTSIIYDTATRIILEGPFTPAFANQQYCVTVGISNTLCADLNCTAGEAGSGLYYVEVGKRNDTVYTGYDPVESEDVAIPHPFADTYFVGDE